MVYDYFAINFAAASGIIFLLIFLRANAFLDQKIKRIFYLLILIEFVEMVTYSLELWTTTFETLSPLRLWLSAVGYSIRPFIFCLILMLATRNIKAQRFPLIFYLPALVNIVTSFSVFFTDIVYSYTPDNLFIRGPLGLTTHFVVLLYLIILTIVVIRSHADRPKFEILIIFAIALLIIFSMAIEAAFSVRTVGRTTVVMMIIFYYMFFQTQIYRVSLSHEQSIRQQLERDNRIDGVTGVLNKKAFMAAVKSILDEQHTRPLSGIGFIFMDLDHLKDINDTMGHAMGDTAIVDAADTIQSLCRKTDLIGRFGGDEFCIFIPDIPKHRFQVCLNEAQARLQREYSVGGASVTATASIGAVYTENVRGLTYERLAQLADDALYEAKASGRNCHIIREI